jgi:hypothetical protein
MTQPDRWDEIATKLMWEARNKNSEGSQALLAAALRDAENAGMERAARIAEKLESALWLTYRKNHEQHTEGMSDGAGKVAGAIRATKETKE